MDGMTSAITVRGMSPDPAVAAMYDRLRQGFNVDRTLQQVQQQGLGPAINRSLGDLSRIQAAQGRTDYNLALSPLNAGLYLQAQNADRAAQARQFSLDRQSQSSGLGMVMQLLSPFLSGVMGQAGV